VLFEEMDIQRDGMMVLDIKKITNVSRGSR
jgi:hypothetical protein